MLSKYFKDKELLEEVNKLKSEIEKKFDVELVNMVDNILYIYEFHHDLTYDEKLSFLYGASLVDTNDPANYVDTIGEGDYYSYLDKMFKGINFEGDRNLIELGIDEIFFTEHLDQMAILDDVYFNTVSTGNLVGRNLFEEINKLKKLEKVILNKYPSFLILHDDMGNSIFNNVQKWIIETYPSLKEYPFDKWMEVMSASYFLRTSVIRFGVSLDFQINNAIERFHKTSLIPEDLKTDIALEYITNGYNNAHKKMLDEYETLNKHIPLVENSQVELLTTLKIAVENQTISSDEYKNILEEFDNFKKHISSPYLLHAILLSHRNTPIDDFKIKASLLYGASMVYEYEKKNLSNFSILDEDTYSNELDKRFNYYKEFFNDIDTLYVTWIRTGMDSAFYDVHRDAVLKNNDWWIHKLKDNCFGESLFHNARRLRDIHSLFSSVYPNAKIIDLENEYSIITLTDWLIDKLPEFYDLSIKDTLEYLSAEYFINQAFSVSKENISNDDLWTLYKRNPIIPEKYKGEVSYNTIFELELKQETDITKQKLLH